MAEAIVAFGSSPVAMAFGEVYSAIQTGRIDVAENNASTYYTSEHYKIAPFYTLTEHVRIPEIIVGSRTAFAELSAEDRLLIEKAAIDSIDFQRAAWKRYERLALERAKNAGVRVIEISDTTRWRALAQSIYERQSAEVRAIISKIRAVE
jgi:TRAP-type C4-dicarboxylate transport system substrate-binding protein